MGLPVPRRRQGRPYRGFPLEPEPRRNGSQAFLRKALHTRGCAPESVTLDGYAASHRAVRELANEDRRWQRTTLQFSKYLNNLVEQDHRGIKSRTRPMLGFKTFASAPTTIAGIELFHRIRKGQF